MKLSRLLILISSLILLTACSEKRVPAPCPSIVVLSKVDAVDIRTNSETGLDKDNTLKAFTLIARLREVERYYSEEATRLEAYVKERNEGLIDGEL